MPGAQISPDAGVTVTIRGVVNAPSNQQIFSGAGKVVGIRRAYAQWWCGMLGDLDDWSPAFEKARDCVMASMSSEGGRPAILYSKDVGFSRTLELNPTPFLPLTVEASGYLPTSGRIRTLSTFNGGGPAIRYNGVPNGQNQVCDFDFGNFSIEKYQGNATIGLQIGSDDPSTYIAAQHYNVLRNVDIYGFAKNLRFVNGFRLMLDRVSLDNNQFVGASVNLQVESKGRFTGDIVIGDGCQFIQNAGQESCNIELYADGDQANGFQIGGIEIGSADFHYAKTQVRARALNGALIDDFMPTAAQFDQNSALLFDVLASGVGAASGKPSGTNGWKIRANYSKGGNLSNDFSMKFRSISGAISRGLLIGEGELLDPAGPIILIEGHYAPQIMGPAVIDNNNTTGAIIELRNCVGGLVTAIACSRTTGSYFAAVVDITGTTDDVEIFGIAHGRIASQAVVRNLGSGTHNRYNFQAIAPNGGLAS